MTLSILSVQQRIPQKNYTEIMSRTTHEVFQTTTAPHLTWSEIENEVLRALLYLPSVIRVNGNIENVS